MVAASSWKVVLVTGCSQGGLGAYLCEEYVRQGCIVYATARNPSSMKFTSPEIRMLKLDVVDDEQVKSVVQTVIDKEGRIDILVNNAGMGCAGPLTDTPVDVIKNVFDANTFSVMRMVQAVFPHMAARKSGLVVNVGSISGEMCVSHFPSLFKVY
ncbi:hypothetical protein NM688_g7860 [Phlebia brevispora]|uniref:Uncharacterized protein n=1 Tax=Phlebia brevispora TaxID=194682 RepID=A0ACC1S0A1_9APHY|nr:hypothetical protein NM688_g7860 [Phlebia brevispora]